MTLAPPMGRETAAVGEADRRHMRRALALAERGWGRASPNPMVGAVLVRDGEVVGEGFHARFGGVHAEVEALRAAGERASGATLYVTLEPCTHHGKTPPCTETVAAAGVRRVVVACRDPNPDSGDGIGVLRAAGLDVEIGLERETAERLNAGFLWSHRHATPFTVLKLALSLDARLSAREGMRSQVTGAGAAEWVHWLRAGFDGILIGRRTASVDDPLLTVRGSIRPRRPPIRVVLDPSLRLSVRSRLVCSVEEAPLWIVAAAGCDPARRRALESAGARVFETQSAGDHELELAGLWRTLRSEGLSSLLVEGGGRLASSLIQAKHVQRLHLVYAPVLFGPAGVPAFPTTVPEVGGWRTVSAERLGRDVVMTLEPATKPVTDGE